MIEWRTTSLAVSSVARQLRGRLQHLGKGTKAGEVGEMIRLVKGCIQAWLSYCGQHYNGGCDFMGYVMTRGQL